MSASAEDVSKKRKIEETSSSIPPGDTVCGDNLRLIDDVSDALHRLTLQKQAETIVKALVDDQRQESDDERLVSIQQMQQEQIVVLKVGGKFFNTTMRTLLGERGRKQAEKKDNDEEMKETNDEEEESDESDKVVEGVTQKQDDCEFVEAQPNLFKVMFDSGIGIDRDDEANKSAISFPDRNPEYFEYVLEHLRQGGKIKSLGVEKLNANQLENILEESNYFATEKLSEYILFLLEKYHKQAASLSEIEESSESKPSNLQKVDIPQVQQRILLVENSITESKKMAKDLSLKLVSKYQNFISGTDLETDMAVNIDVSGQVFTIPFTILQKYETFLISKYILSQNFCLNENGNIFIDRNPTLFALIHGYMISGGKFNHFPKNLSQEKKLQLKKEAEFYGLTILVQEYLDPLRYPVEKIGKDNIELKEKEDKLREIFAKDRESPLLNDPYLLLSPLFENVEEINNQEKYRIDFGECAKLLDLTDKTRYSRQVSKPELINNLSTFKLNWHRLTQGALKGLDWNNVFAAGGGILACCLKPDMPEPTTLGLTLPIKLSEREGKSSKSNVIDDLDENDISDFGFWKLKKTSKPESGKESEQKVEISKYLRFDSPLHRFIVSDDNCTDGRYRSKKLADHTIATVNDKEHAHHIPEPNIKSSFKNSDIDLFLYALSEQQAEEKINHIYQTIKKNLRNRLVSYVTPEYQPVKKSYFESVKVKYEDAVNDDVLVVRTKFAVTFYCYKLRPIQVVLRIYKSPAEILLGFDIDCATVGYDGNQVWSSARARRALAYHTNLVDVDRQSTTYEYRLYKYSKRGFSVSIPGYDTSKVKNELLHYPRRYSFSSTEYLLHGLARLIGFDNSCRSKYPHRVLNIYNRDHEAQLKEENSVLIISGELNVKSDYLDLNIIKSHKYPPSILFDSLEKARKHFEKINLEKADDDDDNIGLETFLLDSRLQSPALSIKKKRDPDWKPHFIYVLNDINTIINNETFQSRLTQKIQFLTVDPGTQKIGSFHPKDINFYRDAYQPVPFTKLPFASEGATDTNDIWYKSMTTPPEENNNNYPMYQKLDYAIPSHLASSSRQSKETWFEVCTPEESNMIEQEYRKYKIFGSPERFSLSESEIVDFYMNTIFYDINHPEQPNTYKFLHRMAEFYSEDVESDLNLTANPLRFNSIF